MVKEPPENQWEEIGLTMDEAKPNPSHRVVSDYWYGTLDGTAFDSLIEAVYELGLRHGFDAGWSDPRPAEHYIQARENNQWKKVELDFIE